MSNHTPLSYGVRADEQRDLAGVPDDQVAAGKMKILTRAKVLLGASAVEVNR